MIYINLSIFIKLFMFPTRCVKDCASLLDHVYVTYRKNVALSFISNIAFSDHFPVGVVWRKPVTKSCTHHRYISYSKPVNHDSYEIKYYLQSLINSICYMKNPHNMVNVLNNAIVSVKSSLPNTCITKRVKRQKQPKWYNRQIKEASIKRDKRNIIFLTSTDTGETKFAVSLNYLNVITIGK